MFEMIYKDKCETAFNPEEWFNIMRTGAGKKTGILVTIVIIYQLDACRLCLVTAKQVEDLAVAWRLSS